MIKKILVYTYGKQPHSNTIKSAANFARLHDAKLMGLFVIPDVMGYSSVYGNYPLNLVQTFYDQQKKYATQAQKQFDKIVKEIGCQGEWHEIEEFEKKPDPAFYADYIFVSQPDRQGTASLDDVGYIDRLIIETGLPIVVIPRSWSGQAPAKQPLLGWKECREAASAVRQTLSLLRAAEEVDIATAIRGLDDGSDVVSGIALSDYLASHTVKCDYLTLKIKDNERSEADALIRHVTENNRDTIVIGGYGHSRLRETILGGVTRDLLRKSPVPVVLSH